MATFVNKAFDISTLGSKLNQILKLPTSSSDNSNVSFDYEQSAKKFLKTQQARVTDVEEQLLDATQYILPPSDESMTITEVAELCRLLQMSTREKIETLQWRFQEAGYTIPSFLPHVKERAAENARCRGPLPAMRATTTISSSSSSTTMISSQCQSPNTPEPASPTKVLTTPLRLGESKIGLPLESVIEGDMETDGITTPRSYFKSPALSTNDSSLSLSYRGPTFAFGNNRNRTFYSKSNVHSSTPPTMDRLMFSAGTTTLLKGMKVVETQTQILPHEQPPMPHREKSNLSHRRSSSLSLVNQQEARRSSSTPTTKRLNSVSAGDDNSFHFAPRPFNVEFRDDDDMITIDTHSTLTKSQLNSPNHRKSKVTKPPKAADEARLIFFARMEGMLDRVEETILEDSSPRFNRDDPSRPSDEIQASLFPQSHSITASNTEGNQHLNSTSKFVRTKTTILYEEKRSSSDELFGEERLSHYAASNSGECLDDEVDDDDSTNMVVTQVASPWHRGRQNEERESKFCSKKPHPLNALQKRPTHILVDTAIASPAHTNITMDATIINETQSSFLRFDAIQRSVSDSIQEHTRVFKDVDAEDSDNLSIVTPILDRYRLDPDDTSIGVKVVPNERGSHQKNSHIKRLRRGHSDMMKQEQMSPLMTAIKRTPKTPKQNTMLPSFATATFLSPAESTPKANKHIGVTSSDKKVYRKTPFPTRKATLEEDNNAPGSLDENDHPNISTESGASSEKFQSTVAVPHISVSVPPLRPRLLESRRLEKIGTRFNTVDVHFPAFRTDHPRAQYSVISREESATINHIDKTIERIDQELATRGRSGERRDYSSGRVDPVGKSFLKKVTSRQDDNCLTQITNEEFEAAPRIVRTQVSMDEANSALNLLEEFCKVDATEGMLPVQFSEERGHEILASLTGSKHRSKSILISLCHWQRLSMRRDAIKGSMLFELHPKADENNFVC